VRNVLVNQLVHNSEFVSSFWSTSSVAGHWMLGSGVWIAFSAWLVALIGR
jgi:hypothetical protein